MNTWSPLIPSAANAKPTLSLLMMNDPNHTVGTRNTILSEKARHYLHSAERRLATLSPDVIADEILAIIDENDDWRRRQCINMICSENTMSRTARKLLDTDFALRTGEGFPGDRVHPPAEQAKFIDQIEAIVFGLAKRLFRSSFVEWRPTSSTMANTIVLHTQLRRGDLILSQSEDGGGNYSYHRAGGPGLIGLKVMNLPYRGEAFEIDVEETERIARQSKPKMLVIGGSNVLFPYPLQALRQIADRIGAKILYDGAHIGVFVAGQLFQDPLREGADFLTISTHKSFGGPIGGIIFTDSEEAYNDISTSVHPTFMQTRGQSAFCALAMTLAEHAKFAAQYAGQMVLNAKALGSAFSTEGFRVIAEDRGYTETHQLYLSFGSVDSAKRAQTVCQEANILVAANYLAGDMTRGGRTGNRMSTQELTKQGMKENEMREIARFMRRLILDRESPQTVKADVAEFVKPFQRVEYGFDPFYG